MAPGGSSGSRSVCRLGFHRLPASMALTVRRVIHLLHSPRLGAALGWSPHSQCSLPLTNRTIHMPHSVSTVALDDDSLGQLDALLSSAASTLNVVGLSGGLVQSDWDDGHVPEGLDAATTKTQLVDYAGVLPDPEMAVCDDALNESLVRALFQTTTAEETTEPWGTYVTIDRIREHWRQLEACGKESGADQDGLAGTNQENHRDQLALRAAAGYWKHALRMTTPQSVSWEHRAHGIAVWALSAAVHSSVPYHLDYAEQIRYATNVIVPPLLAGTLHCTPPCLRITGGDLCLSWDGLEHYRKHGYKGVRSPVVEEEMVRIPYRFNRLIVAPGQWPHLSTRIESIEPASSSDHQPSLGPHQYRRVIVGFNVFGHDVGPLVQRAPEHSHTFRAWVQYRRQRCVPRRGMTLAMVQGHPALARRLVQAKRAWQQAQLNEAQRQLETDILEHVRRRVGGLVGAVDRNKDLVNAKVVDGPVTIAELMEVLGNSDGSWPNANDVVAHLYSPSRNGKLWRLVPPHRGQLNDDDEHEHRTPCPKMDPTLLVQLCSQEEQAETLLLERGGQRAAQ